MNSSRENNFDLLRLLLASTVAVHHLDDLTHSTFFDGWRNIFSGAFAVQGFFVISGYLIFQSWERSASWRDYTEKRIRRLYPAYFVSIVFFTVVAGWFSTLGWNAYARSPEIARYLAANLVFANFAAESLPGVFRENVMSAVNGALWTIKVEVMFYVSVPFLCVIFQRTRPWIGCLAVYLFSIAWVWYFTAVRPNPTAAKQLPGQFMFFMGGACLYFYRETFLRHARWLLPCAVIGFWLNPVHQIPWLRAAAVALLIGGLVFVVPFLGRISRHGDFSYGIYIVHFPVIQLFASTGIYERSPVAGCIATFATIGILAFASWHLVERRFLSAGSHYLQASRPTSKS